MRGYAKQITECGRPLLLPDVHEQSARRHGCIGKMMFAAGPAPNQKSIQGANPQFATLQPCQPLRVVLQHDAQLWSKIIRCQRQAGKTADRFLVPPQSFAASWAAIVLP